MGYFSYHNTAKGLILAGKLLGYYYTPRHNCIAPALVLVFLDEKHPKMTIRQCRWEEYMPLLPPEKQWQPP